MPAHLLRGALVVIALAAGSTTALAGRASAAWTQPMTLASPAAENLAVAGSDAQSQAFVWKVTTRHFVRTRTQSGYASYVRVRLRQPLGKLVASRAISATTAIVTNPSVTMDYLGNATAVWTQADRRIRVMGAYRPRGGQFGRPFEIGRSGAFNDARPQVAVAPIEGTTTVVWNAGSQLLVSRRRPGRCGPGRPRGCFSSPQRYARGTDQTIAVTPEGTTFIVWAATVREGDVVHTRLRLVSARRGRRFGHSQAIGAGGDASQPSLALAPDGSVIVAWRASLPAGGEQNLDAPILAAIRDPNGATSSAQTISQLPGSTPQVGVNPQGEAVAVWSQINPTPTNPDGREVAAALRPASRGAFEPPVRLHAANVSAGSPSLAVESSGDMTVVYSASVIEPGGSSGPAAISLRRTSGSPFGTPETLPTDFSGAFVFAAGARVTAVSGGSGGRTLISDVAR